MLKIPRAIGFGPDSRTLLGLIMVARARPYVQYNDRILHKKFKSTLLYGGVLGLILCHI
jgi:hypothetical protein